MSSLELDLVFITTKLSKDLALGKVKELDTTPSPFISSLLSLVPKHDSSFRRIHYLSYPKGSLVNDHIEKRYSAIKYLRIEDVYLLVVSAGKGCTIVKKDIKDAFRNIPVALAS